MRVSALIKFSVGTTLAVTLGLSAQAQTITHQIALPSGVNWCEDSMINGLFTEINSFRVKNGLPALKMDSLGMKDAEMRAVQFSAYMAAYKPGTPLNPHEGFDTTAASLGYDLVGENLAYVTSDPTYIVNGGWQDPLHLAALLSSAANVAGVSCVYANGFPYWTYEPGVASGGAPAPTPTPPPTPTPTPSPTPTPTGGTPALDSEEWSFVNLLNNFRAQNGVGPVQVSVALENSSRWMSSDMATKNYFSHTDSLGRTTGVRLAAFGYTYAPWGEDLAAGYADAQSALSGFQNACDPDASGNCTYAHRKILLGSGFAAVGVARAYGSSSAYGWYWTVDFGGQVDQPVTPGSTPTPTPATAPAINSFSANPTVIQLGGSAGLNWNVSGADTITIDNGVGNVTASGSRTVTPTKTTTYHLTATNKAGSTTAAATITVNAPIVDLQPPTAPIITSITAASSTKVNLAWSASSDNIGVAGYQISRDGALIATVQSNTLAYTDGAVAAGTQYAYVVRAYDAAGNYASSNAAQVTTPGAAGAPAPSTCGVTAKQAFTGCYYNNIALTGAPALVRTDPEINFNWFSTPPARSMSLMNYSVHWQGLFNFAEGDYAFNVVASDGVRLYIDGALVLNQWHDQAAYMFQIHQKLSQGTHLIAVDYYERNGSAVIQVGWQQNTRASR